MPILAARPSLWVTLITLVSPSNVVERRPSTLVARTTNRYRPLTSKSLYVARQTLLESSNVNGNSSLLTNGADALDSITSGSSIMAHTRSIVLAPATFAASVTSVLPSITASGLRSKTIGMSAASEIPSPNCTILAIRLSSLLSATPSPLASILATC